MYGSQGGLFLHSRLTPLAQKPAITEFKILIISKIVQINFSHLETDCLVYPQETSPNSI